MSGERKESPEPAALRPPLGGLGKEAGDVGACRALHRGLEVLVEAVLVFVQKVRHLVTYLINGEQ